MKLTKLSVFFTACMAMNAALAGSLSVADGVEVLAFDGLKVRKQNPVVLGANKQHQLVVEVARIVGNDHYFSTDPVVLTFQTEADENVEIDIPKIKNTQQADEFKAKPTFTLKTASGKVLSHHQDFLKGEGFVPNARVEENLSKYNLSKSTASVPAFAAAVLEKKGQIVVNTDNVAFEQLQTIYKKADKATQQRFLDWVKTQK